MCCRFRLILSYVEVLLRLWLKALVMSCCTGSVTYHWNQTIV